MAKSKASLFIPDEKVINKIYMIRGQKVMLDIDLAELYRVEVRVLNQAVKRNSERFPKDFMFTLTHQEFQNLKSQIVTSSWGGRRKLPSAFTRCCHALRRVKQFYRYPGKYSDHPHFYQNEGTIDD